MNQPSLLDAIHQAHILYDSGEIAACRNLCQQIQRQSPDRPRILNLLALIEYGAGNHARALEYIQTALEKRSDLLEFHNTMGLIYMAMGKPADANKSFIRAYELLPNKINHPDLPKIYSNIANSLNVQGKYTEAIEFHNHALSINKNDPYALWNRGNIYLLHGRFDEGWEGYEHRFEVRFAEHKKNVLKHNIPKWDGSDLHGKRLLVQDEQGYGDTIQFSRYLPKLADYGGEVIFETRIPLAELLKDTPGVMKICLKRDQIYKKEDFDFHIHLCSLPGIFATDINSIPDKLDSLYINPEKINEWQSRLPAGNFRVGLVWTGNLNNVLLRHRSCHLTLLEPLLACTGVTYVGLQKGDKLGEVTDLPSSLQFINLGDEFDSFSDTAAVIAQLDHIITIDTAIAHLAATMGKPVWLMLSLPPDFRWLLKRKDSPWYPTMKIFRQTEHGDWKPVVHEITEALQVLINNL